MDIGPKRDLVGKSGLWKANICYFRSVLCLAALV